MQHADKRSKFSQTPSLESGV